MYVIPYLVRIYLNVKVLEVEFPGQRVSFVPVIPVKDIAIMCSSDVVQHTLPTLVMSVSVSAKACHPQSEQTLILVYL